MYYPSSENKGADQLRGYREADLRLCFRLCKLLVFSRGDSVISDTPRKLVHAIYRNNVSCKNENFVGKILICLIFLLQTLIVDSPLQTLVFLFKSGV